MDPEIQSDELAKDAEQERQDQEQQKDQVEDEQLAALYPGREIELTGAGDRKLTVKVWPMGIRDFRRFKDAIRSVVEEISIVGFDWAKAKEDWQTVLLPLIITVVVDHFLELLNESVDGIDLMSRRCPQWVLPPVAQAWLLESFGSEDKLRPWSDLVDEVASRVGGKKPQIWQMLTKSSLRPATGSMTSDGTPPAPSPSGSKRPSNTKERPRQSR